jgi:hypothetical protein
MTNSDSLDEEMLAAYSAGVVTDENIAAQVRSSPAAVKWLANDRLTTILLLRVGAENQPSELNDEVIDRFLKEDLPPNQMKDVEHQIAASAELFELYLNKRIESLADNIAEVSSEKDEEFLSKMLATINAGRDAGTAEQRAEVAPTDSANGRDVRDYGASRQTPGLIQSVVDFIQGIFPFPNMAAAGGFASVALIAVIGAWQLELFGPRTLPPMVMASVQLPEAELRFRGGAKKVTKPAQGNNSTKIFENSSQTILGGL